MRVTCCCGLEHLQVMQEAWQNVNQVNSPGNGWRYLISTMCNDRPSVTFVVLRTFGAR